MIMGASSQSHDDIHLKVLSTLSEVFLKDLSQFNRKVFHEDGYGKNNEISSFK